MKEITKQSLIFNLIQTICIIAFISLCTQVFGQQEALTSVATVTTLLMFFFIPLPTSGIEGTLLTSIGFFSFGLLASLNLVLPGLIMLPINMISILTLMLVFGHPFQYKYYLPFILLYIFSSTTEVADFNIKTRILYLAISSLMIAIVYYSKHHHTKDAPHLLQKSNLSQKLRHAALVLSLGASISLFLIDHFNITKGMWICTTVLSLTQIESEHSKLRFKHRIIGSLVGTITYLLIFSVIVPSKFHMIAVLLVGYVYSFVEDYFIQIIFITMNVLFAAREIFTFGEAFATRLTFILLGSILFASISYLLNYLKSSNNKRSLSKS